MSVQPSWITIRQGMCVTEAEVPRVGADEFARHVAAARERGGRLSQLFGRRIGDGSVRVNALVAFDEAGAMEMCAMELRGERLAYPSVTALWPAAQAFEREIAEQYGVEPVGHPWLKPLRYHDTDNGSRQPWGKFDSSKPIPGDYPFYRVDGEEVHEVAVGPVHASIIEPGHFRFQCHGEEILHSEVALGYQHRGAEPLLLHPNATRSAMVAETIAGDASVGHALAYCVALEGLAGVNVSARAGTIRGIAVELEQLANHVGDLGALGTDIGFLPTSAFLGRLRGDFLNLTLEICGNRFGRNLLRPGGAMFDIDAAMAARIRTRLEELQDEVLQVLELLFSQPSVLARFEGAGALSSEQAEEVGMVGPAARACGCARDVRHDHPHGVFSFRKSLSRANRVAMSTRARWCAVLRCNDRWSFC